MTLTAFPPAPAVSRPQRTLSISIGALITSACVAGGAMVALATLHPVVKPADVAKAYLEARYAGDWTEAWALECDMTGAFVGGYAGFVVAAANWDEALDLPRHVEVTVGRVHHSETPGGFAAVTATVTSPEQRGWSISGEVPLVEEHGQFRVCDGGLRLG